MSNWSAALRNVLLAFFGTARDIAKVERDLEVARKAYRLLIAEWQQTTGQMFIPFAETIPNELIQGCKFMANREYILMDLPKGGKVVEVGTQTGYFARKIIDLMIPSELHLLDISWSLFDDKFIRGVMTKVEKHEGDSSTLLSQFPDDYFDVIYVDADHSYEGVWRDIEAAKSKVKSGGHLIFNDYTVWSPIEVQRYGVMHAVNEFCARDRWPVAYFGFQGVGYHDLGLRRP